MEVTVERIRSAWNIRYFLVTAGGRKFIRKSLACAMSLRKILERPGE